MQAQPYQLLPELTVEEFSALKRDIAARGVLVPVELDDQGQLLDGHHRVKAWTELRAEGVVVADYPAITRTGMSEAEKRSHVRALNLHRRHLTRHEKQELIEAQLRDTPEKSNRQLAKVLGVDDKTVGVARDRLEAGAEIPHLNETIGADGKKYPARMPERPQAAPNLSLVRGLEGPPPARPPAPMKSAEDLINEALPEWDRYADSSGAIIPSEEFGRYAESRVGPPPGASALATLPAPADTLDFEPTPALQPASRWVPSSYVPAPRNGSTKLETANRVSLYIEWLFNAPLTGEEFKRVALPAMLQDARAQIPAVRALLDEIERTN